MECPLDPDEVLWGHLDLSYLNPSAPISPGRRLICSLLALSPWLWSLVFPRLHGVQEARSLAGREELDRLFPALSWLLASFQMILWVHASMWPFSTTACLP